MDTAWAVILFLAAALFAGGLATLTLKHPPDRFAELCLIFAAIIIGAWFWIWTSMADETPMWIRLLIGLAVGAFCFVVVPESIRLIRTDKNQSEKPKTTEQPTQRGPTLEATNRSKIDATGAVIPGDLPFQFGKADQDSIIDIPGINVTKNADGTFRVSPGHVHRQFPPPTGEFSALSDPELGTKVKDVMSELRQFNSAFRKDAFPPYTKVGPLPEEYIQHTKDSFHEHRKLYEEKFAQLAMSLSAEMLARIGSIEGNAMSPSAIEGSVAVYHKRFMGITTAESVADFLEALARKLPKK